MHAGRRFTDLEPAGFARRFAAFLIDVTIVLVAVVFLLQLVLAPLTDAFGPGWVRVGWFYAGYTLLTVSLPIWLYFAGYEASSERATLGKQWLGLMVTGTDGGRAALPRTLLRTILKLLPFEIAHLAVALPANPFVDPLTGRSTMPTLEDLGGSLVAGLLVAMLLLGASLLTIALHPDRRAPHDLAAGTYVMRDGRTDEAVDAAASSVPASHGILEPNTVRPAGDEVSPSAGDSPAMP